MTPPRQYKIVLEVRAASFATHLSTELAVEQMQLQVKQAANNLVSELGLCNSALAVSDPVVTVELQ